jgi:phosphate starvation-inducible PhoH-like protein
MGTLLAGVGQGPGPDGAGRYAPFVQLRKGNSDFLRKLGRFIPIRSCNGPPIQGVTLTKTIVRDRVQERRVSRKVVRAKTPNQQDYLDSIEVNTITLGVGPAGTGKTFLAVERAISALQSGMAERLIMTRPAIEAGENLGFLPGTLEDKLDPYLRPLFDAIQDIAGRDQFLQWQHEEVLEIAPLAFMRGRTLNNAFIILDEAQNTTPTQMKMFLTRLGFGSKLVITGDITQTDIKGLSGLEQAARLLDGVEDVGVCELTSRDIVRHPLVARILAAYEADE